MCWHYALSSYALACELPMHLRLRVANRPKVVDRYVDVPYLQTVEKIVEVPQIHQVDRFVEVPRVQIQEVVKHVARVEYQEVVHEVPKITTQVVERVVEVPQVQFVDRFVEVPQIQYQEVVKHVARIETTIFSWAPLLKGEGRLYITCAPLHTLSFRILYRSSAHRVSLSQN